MSDEIKKYEYFKKSFINEDKKSNKYKFFTGLNEFSNYKFIKKEKNIFKFNILKYAALIFIVAGIISIMIPFGYKKVMERKYRIILYSDLIHPYADDAAKNIEIENINDDYLSSNELDESIF